MLKTNRLTDIGISTVTNVMKQLNRLGRFPVLVSRASNHIEDDNLYLVLGENRKTSPISYDIWFYNNKRDSLDNGAYGLTFKEALKRYSDRLLEIG